MTTEKKNGKPEYRAPKLEALNDRDLSGVSGGIGTGDCKVGMSPGGICQAGQHPAVPPGPCASGGTAGQGICTNGGTPEIGCATGSHPNYS